MRTFNRAILLVVMYSLCSSAFAASYDASVNFAHRVTLSVPVTGEINKVNVKPGQAVHSGDVLIALDKTPFEAAVVQAQAAVTTHATETKETGRDYEQLKELYDRGVLSTVELENGSLKHERAKAAYSSAQAHLTQAQYDLAHTSIVAPFDGWVLQVSVNKNETVNNAVQSQPLLILAETNKYIARTKVPLKNLASLKIGKPGTISIGNSTFKGSISAIALEPVEGDKTSYSVDVEFDSKGILLRAGQTAKVDI